MSSSPESPRVKPKKSRNRKAASCNPCRARKLRCDRALPCSSCSQKGHPELCVWDSDAAPPLYEARERNETENLRHEVDRLQSLISVLIESKNSPPPAPHQNPFPIPSYAGSTFGGAGSASSERGDEPKDEDLAAHDLAQKLGHLTIKAFHVGNDKDNTDPLVKEAQEILESSSSSFPSPHADGNFILNSPQPAAAFSVFPFARSQATTLEILARLPSKAQADAAARFYFVGTDWYMHMIPAYIFTQHAEQVWLAQARGTPADAFSLAIVFSVWAVGLFGMSPSKSAASGLPSTQSAKDALATEWLELSSSALASGRFLERPTLEAIRALLLLATHYVALSPGDNGGTGIAYLVLTMQCCVQLRMHRDPEKTPGRYSAGEAEDRRRLWWLTFLAAQTATTTYGRKTSMLHLSDIDTKLPSDIGDELMGSGRGGNGGETMMTSLIIRIKISKLAEKISDEVFGIQPVSYSQVLAYDCQVSQLEADVFPHYRYSSIDYEIQQQPIRALRSYMIQLGICQERLRLHRPYLARSYVDETFAYSRTMCLRAAKQILEMQATPLCQAPWSGLQYKSCQSAIIFCIDLLYTPYGSQAANQRAMVDVALKTMDKFAKHSTLCRRAGKVICFMLAKLPPNSPAALPAYQPGHPSQPKRSRTDSDPRASRSPQHSNSPTYTHSLDGHPSASEEALPRKIPSRSTSSSSSIPTSSIYPSPPIPAPSTINNPTNNHSLHLAEELGSFDFNAILGLGSSSGSAPSPPFGSSFGSNQSGISLFPPHPQHTPSPPVFRPTIGGKSNSATSFDFGAPVPNGLVGPGAPFINENIGSFATSTGQRLGSGTPVPRPSSGVKSNVSEGFVFGAGLDGVVAGEEFFNPLGIGMSGVQDQQSYAFGGIDAGLEMGFSFDMFSAAGPA